MVHRPSDSVDVRNGSTSVMSDLRLRVIATVMAALTIAQHRAAAALTVGDQVEADRFETEVREAEQRLARLHALRDQMGLSRHDYLF